MTSDIPDNIVTGTTVGSSSLPVYINNGAATAISNLTFGGTGDNILLNGNGLTSSYETSTTYPQYWVFGKSGIYYYNNTKSYTSNHTVGTDYFYSRIVNPTETLTSNITTHMPISSGTILTTGSSATRVSASSNTDVDITKETNTNLLNITLSEKGLWLVRYGLYAWGDNDNSLIKLGVAESSSTAPGNNSISNVQDRNNGGGNSIIVNGIYSYWCSSSSQKLYLNIYTDRSGVTAAHYSMSAVRLH